MKRPEEKFGAEGTGLVYALYNRSPFCSSKLQNAGPGCLVVWFLAPTPNPTP